MKLTPIAMRRVTDDMIYAPSKIRPSVEVNEGEYQQCENKILVSFEDDGKSNPEPTTAYTTRGVSLNGWFIKKEE